MFIKMKNPDSEMTPDEKIIAAQKQITRLTSKKTVVGYKYSSNGEVPIYKKSSKNQKIDNKIDIERLKIKLAEQAKNNPPPAPKTVINNNQKQTTIAPHISVKVNSDNTKEVKASAEYHKHESGDKHNENGKRISNNTKRKFNFNVFFITLTFFLIAVVVLAVFIDYKLNVEGKDTSSTYTAINL